MKFTRQFDQMDCGPACIRMVASAYGKDYPLSYLRSLSHLTREGVSGGEKQRIMIARAAYKRPVYLMLDEATSSLDAENERRITDNIARTFENRTRIVIAHRLSTVRNADRIIVLRHGRVMEQGTHAEGFVYVGKERLVDKILGRQRSDSRRRTQRTDVN